MLSDQQKKGSHSTCEIVRIKAANDDGFTEINAHDFNADNHELFDGNVAVREPAPVMAFVDMKKAELAEWLTAKGVAFEDGMTKAELIELCEKQSA